MRGTLAEWNERQRFDHQGIMYQVATLSAGGYAVLRLDRSTLPRAMVAADPVPTAAEAVAQAEQLQHAALH